MQTYRMIFRKTGDSKFLSHLDLMRCFTRAVKRTGYNAWYTEGFNPHLYLMFVSPLSLGFESDYEAVDIRLDENCDLSDFMIKLNASLPRGVEVYNISPVEINYKDLGYSVWEIRIYKDNSDLSKQDILDYIDQPSILMTKVTKKGNIKEEDIKKYIKRISIEEDNDTFLIEAVFVTDLSVSLNPQFFLEGLWKYKNLSHFPDVRITRKCILDNKGEKMI